MTLTVNRPKMAQAMRRRLRKKVLHRFVNGYALKQIWEFIEEAYSLGYAEGHEDQMQMRIRDAMEREAHGG